MQARHQRDYGRLPLHFEPNRGQSAETAKFLARGPGYALFLTEQELVLRLQRGAAVETTGPPDPSFVGPPEPPNRPAVLRLGFVGANPKPVIEGLEPLGGHSNYFLGNDTAKWRTGIPHYRRVQIKALYPGIDLVLYGNPQQLEYDFVVAPGADSGQIRLSLSGAEAVRLDDAGDLVLDFPGGTLRQRAPTVYQDQEGERRAVEGGYRLLSPSEEQVSAAPELAFDPETRTLIGFRVAAYDPDEALVIDPALVYSTYLGGGGRDEGWGIAVDTAGNAYVTGETESSDFPTANALYSNNSGFSDAFVTKLNAAGTGLVYSAYLGGVDGDYGYDIAVDDAGNAYVTGVTESSDFPMANARFPNIGGPADAFVAKLNPDGTVLVYSTYLGGSDGDIGNGIAVDGAGNAYVTGETESSDFPTANALYPNNGGFSDAFVTKMHVAGTALVYSTYLGGSDGDIGNGIALDSAGNAYVTGETESSDFPVANALYPDLNGTRDAFITTLDASGAALAYSTYLGGSDYDEANSIAVDGAGNAYVTGETISVDFPTVNAHDPDYNWLSAAFVTKFNTTGSALVYSTYLGFIFQHSGSGIAVDRAGNAYVAGRALVPTSGFNKAVDAFVTKLNAAGKALDYFTYLGGFYATDKGNSIAVDGAGNAYVTGITNALDFSTVNVLYPDNSGGDDAFVTRIASADPAAIGVYRPGNGSFYLDANHSWAWEVSEDAASQFGLFGDQPIVGDWNGDSVDEIGIWFPGTRSFVLDTNGDYAWDVDTDVVAPFGMSTDLPVIGDWNGDGMDDIGVWRPATHSFFLDTDGDYAWDAGIDLVAPFGRSTDLPVIGDWNGDGIDDIGVWRPGSVFFLDMNGNYTWDEDTDLMIEDFMIEDFGMHTDRPIIGDWNGDDIDDIGLWRPTASSFILDTNGNYALDPDTDLVAPFGMSTDLPVIGDWNGDGIDDIGVWRPANGSFFLDTNGNYSWDPDTDLVAPFDMSSDDLPVIGDWNRDGVDDIGVWRPAARGFFLDTNGNYAWDPGTDLVAPFGMSTDLPVIGDWNGDNIDDIGVWRPSTRSFFLDTNGDYAWDAGTDLFAPFGLSTDLPVIGDWNGDGIDEIGVWRPSEHRFFLDTNGNYAWDAGTDLTASFGYSTDLLPIAGDWNGDGVDEIGVWRPATHRFFLDINGNDAWDMGTDLIANFGVSTDLPVAGRW